MDTMLEGIYKIQVQLAANEVILRLDLKVLP